MRMSLLHDLRLAVRSLRRGGAATLIAVACLALGFGVNTGVFSVLYAVLLRPLSYSQPESLMTVWQTYESQGLDHVALSPADFVDYQREQQGLEQLAALYTMNFTLTGGDEPERVTGLAVSPHLPEILGIEPHLGRGFTDDEAQSGRQRVAMLGYGLWQRLAGGHEECLGKEILLNGEAYTIVGVLPPELGLYQAQLWVPLERDIPLWENRLTHGLRAVARLAPGVTQAQAEASLQGIAERLQRQYPDANTGIGVRLLPIREEISGSVRPALWLLFGASFLVLLLACGNVIHLLLARGVERQRELAIQAAFGAGRPRLIGQLLVESFVLAQVAGLLGLGLAVVSLHWVEPLARDSLPPGTTLQVAWPVLAFGFVVATVTVGLFGLIPALRASRTDVTTALKEGGHGATWSAGFGRLSSVLVVSELALALALVMGAALLSNSLVQLYRVNPGFEPEGLLAVDVALPAARYPEPAQQAEFVRQLLDELAAEPGVEAAAVAAELPLSGRSRLSDFDSLGRPPRQPGEAPFFAGYRRVSPDYFQTMRIPLVQGELFTAADLAGRPRVAVVSESMALRMWPEGNPVGQQLRPGDDADPEPWWTVVGVVGDVHHESLQKEPDAEVYVPLAQDMVPRWSLVMRAAEGVDLVTAAKSAIRRVDAEQPVFLARPYRELVASSRSQTVFNSALVMIFAGLGLVLAAMGVYGSFSYAVFQRRREFAIRLALGATQEQVLSMVMRRGMAMAVLGLAGGGLVTWATSRWLTSLLFGVRAGDPATLVAAAVLLLVVASIALAVPARRAMRLEPTQLLRQQ